MKKSLVVLLLLSLFAMPVFAVEDVTAIESDTAVAQEPNEVGNKICPVSGEEVGGMGDVVRKEYKGKLYNLCCAMCAKDFDKDPEKYSKIADEEVQTADSVQEK